MKRLIIAARQHVNNRFGTQARHKNGFTLVELVVVVALLAMVFAVAFGFFLTHYKLFNNEQKDIDLTFELQNASARLSDEIKESRCVTGSAIRGQAACIVNAEKPLLVFLGEDTDKASALTLRIVTGTAIGETDGKYLEIRRTVTDSAVNPPLVQETVRNYLYIKSVAVKAMPESSTLDDCQGVAFELSANLGTREKRIMTMGSISYFRIDGKSD